MSITPEREGYHKILPEFFELVGDSEVYDIGKSGRFKYSDWHNNLLTVDINPQTNPDIVHDICMRPLTPLCSAILCNGVAEQCDNPFQMINNIYFSLHHGGYALFGIVLLSYKRYTIDYFRFTEAGVDKALKRFSEVKRLDISDNGEKTYTYRIVKKR